MSCRRFSNASFIFHVLGKSVLSDSVLYFLYLFCRCLHTGQFNFLAQVLENSLLLNRVLILFIDTLEKKLSSFFCVIVCYLSCRVYFLGNFSEIEYFNVLALVIDNLFQFFNCCIDPVISFLGFSLGREFYIFIEEKGYFVF